jgi:hypothetical protein
VHPPGINDAFRDAGLVAERWDDAFLGAAQIRGRMSDYQRIRDPWLPEIRSIGEKDATPLYSVVCALSCLIS